MSYLEFPFGQKTQIMFYLEFFFEQEADNVLSTTLFKGEKALFDIWVHYPPHPLQEQEPQGDRKWIKSFPILMVS